MRSNVQKVYPEYVHEQMNLGMPVQLIDVRSPTEFRAEHAGGAKQFSLDEITASKLKAEIHPDAGTTQPVYLICTAGIRAEQAALKLKSEGLNNLYVVNGGTDAWKSLDLPLVTSAGSRWYMTLSPQAQAQMFMGLILMVLAIKGLILHPGFIFAVAAVGLLMMVASIDQRFCVAKVFSELPWNKA